MTRTALAVALAGALAAPAGAMFPPTSASQIGMTAVPRGLSAPGGDGLGVALSTRYMERTRLRSGTSDVANPGGERSLQVRTTLILDHRVWGPVSAVAVVPHLYNEAESGGRLSTASGIGDAAVLARVSVFKRPSVTRQEIFLQAGVELPTGKTNAKDGSGARLALSQQPGSDSLDWIVGAAAVWSLWNVSFYGDAAYKRAGRETYTFGDAAAFNAGFNYPLKRVPELALAAELNLEVAGHDRSKVAGPAVLADGTVRDTGGETLYLTPSLQWRPGKSFSLSAGVQVPVYQRLNGTQLKANVAPNAGFSARFKTL